MLEAHAAADQERRRRFSSIDVAEMRLQAERRAAEGDESNKGL